jgi:hypothetical protein
MTIRRAPLLLLALALGCAVERGRRWDTPAPPLAPDAAPTVSLLLIGGAGFPGRTAARTAAEVERTLADHQRRGVPTVVLWLGDAVGDAGLGPGCGSPGDAWSAPGTGDLARVVRAHQARGGASFAVLGRHEWRCGAPELAFQTGQGGPHPWQLPAANYVVRVQPDGGTRVVSFCSAGLCTVEPAEDGALVDLVVLDTVAWLAPPPEGTRGAAAAQTVLTQQAALLAALDLTARPGGPPRVLVTHHPVETAGVHGQGGLWPDSAFFLHAEPLRRAVARGDFAGVVSGHDRTLSATGDLFDAVKRSSRFWLKRPVFQVVAGGAAYPDVQGGRRGWVYYGGQSLKPDLMSNRAGFAELVVTPTSFAARLHQRRRGRWRAAELKIPAVRPPHPAETASPVMDPCLYCDPVPPRQ